MIQVSDRIDVLNIIIQYHTIPMGQTGAIKFLLSHYEMISTNTYVLCVDKQIQPSQATKLYGP